MLCAPIKFKEVATETMKTEEDKKQDEGEIKKTFMKDLPKMYVEVKTTRVAYISGPCALTIPVRFWTGHLAGPLAEVKC